MTELKSTAGVTAEEVLAYVAAHYVPVETLAAETQVPAGRILELIDAECVPPHAYEIAGEVVISSAFGSYRQPMAPRRVYPPSLAGWIRRAEPMARALGLAEAARRIRAEFLAPIAAGLADRWLGGPETAWALLRDGSWGLCLKEVTPDNAVAKESARAAVAALAAAGGGDPAQLRRQIDVYDAVTLPFAPHERPESSRSREIDPARPRVAAAR